MFTGAAVIPLLPVAAIMSTLKTMKVAAGDGCLKAPLMLHAMEALL